MKRIIFILCFLLVIQKLQGQSLKVIYGNSLYLQYNKELILIKQMKKCSHFRGYDVIDSNNIFIAYQPENYAEAITYISIYNIQTKKETIIEEIGGTCESLFSYNSLNKMVLFNSFHGINIFKLYKENGEIVNKINSNLILEGNYYLSFWVDEYTIGYYVFQDDQLITKYYSQRSQ